jgi:2-dehydropantoate 2-reductase
VRVAVVGAGAMGSVYAALLAAAGNEVLVVDAWEAHVAAIREHGLRVEGASGDRVVAIDATTAPAAAAGPVDLLVLATKAMDVRDAAEGARPLVGPGTLVLPIQNGLGSADAVAEILGDDAVAIGVAEGFGASIVGPGHAHHHGMALVRLGERHGPVTPRIEEVAALWRAAGFTVETYDDVDRLVWQKVVCNVSFSGTCALLDLTIGEVLADPDAWRVASACGTEAHAVAVASGVDLGIDDPVAYVAAFGERIADARPSLALDLRAGRRTEVDVLNGAIADRARTVGVAAPVNAVVADLVRACERLDAAGKPASA